jgi:hypothetical protein
MVATAHDLLRQDLALLLCQSVIRERASKLARQLDDVLAAAAPGSAALRELDDTIAAHELG